MQGEEINKYITTFAELARKALYHEDDPAVLEKFKSGLPLKLLEPCMHHDDPRSWEAWTRSTRTRQAILTSIRIHQADAMQRLPSPMEVYPYSTINATSPLYGDR